MTSNGFVKKIRFKRQHAFGESCLVYIPSMLAGCRIADRNGVNVTNIFSLFFWVIFVLLWYCTCSKQLFTSVSWNGAIKDIDLNASPFGEY